MTETRRNPEEILEAPYSRVMIPDPETGTFMARISEFPGCVAQGDSIEEAFQNLHEAALDWLRAALDLGQDIPEPVEEQTYSGRVLVRLPKSVHRRAAELAEREGTSLNQFIVSAVSERIGATSTAYSLLDRVQEAVSTDTLWENQIRGVDLQVFAPSNVAHLSVQEPSVGYTTILISAGSAWNSPLSLDGATISNFASDGASFDFTVPYTAFQSRSADLVPAGEHKWPK